VLDRRGHRLVADNMEPAPDERSRNREVDVVGRDDGHEIDALLRRECRLALGHRFVALVYSLPIEMQLSTLGPRLIAVRRKGARDEGCETLQRGGAAVYGTDERTGAATNHPEAKLAREGHRDHW